MVDSEGFYPLIYFGVSDQFDFGCCGSDGNCRRCRPKPYRKLGIIDLSWYNMTSWLHALKMLISCFLNIFACFQGQSESSSYGLPLILPLILPHFELSCSLRLKNLKTSVRSSGLRLRS